MKPPRINYVTIKQNALILCTFAHCGLATSVPRKTKQLNFTTAKRRRGFSHIICAHAKHRNRRSVIGKIKENFYVYQAHIQAEIPKIRLFLYIYRGYQFFTSLILSFAHSGAKHVSQPPKNSSQRVLSRIDTFPTCICS